MTQPIDFIALAKAQTNARMRIRLLALAHFQDGHTRTQIALFLKVSRASVNKWVAQFHERGLEGLESARPTGRIARLTPQQRVQLYDFIDEQSRRTTGGRLTGYDIQAYIAQNFGVTYQLSNIYRLLKQMGFSWLTSRSRHPKQDSQAQQAFKKTSHRKRS